MDVDQLLTSTRSARKTLDLEAAVDLDEVGECLRIGLHAANGTNNQSWRWIVVADADRRRRIADLYREGYESMTGGPISESLPLDTDFGRLMSSTEWLVYHLADVPLFVIPCFEPYLPRHDGDQLFYDATLYGSIFPAVWNVQLALRSRGLRHVHHDDALAARGRSRKGARHPRQLHPGLLVAGSATHGREHAADAAQTARRRDRVGPLGRTTDGREMNDDADLAQQVRTLTDRAEIVDCLARYAPRDGPLRSRAGALRVPRRRGRRSHRVRRSGRRLPRLGVRVPLGPSAAPALHHQHQRRAGGRRRARRELLPVHRHGPRRSGTAHHHGRPLHRSLPTSRRSSGRSRRVCASSSGRPSRRRS